MSVCQHRIISTLATFICVIVLLTIPAACSDSPIYVDPLLDVFAFHAESFHSGSFVVTNPGASPKSVVLTQVDFALNEMGGVSILEALALESRSIQPFAVFWPTSFSLMPGEQQVVEYEVKRPADGLAHWGGVIVEQRRDDDSNNSAFVQHLETRFLFALVQLADDGCVGEPSTIELESADWSDAEAGGVLTVRLKLSNASNCVVRASGTIELIDDEGASIGFEATSSFTVFPYSGRVITVRMSLAELTAGDYGLKYSFVQWNGESTSGEILLAVGESDP